MKTYKNSVLEMSGVGVEVLIDDATGQIMAAFQDGTLLASFSHLKELIKDDVTAVC